MWESAARSFIVFLRKDLRAVTATGMGLYLCRKLCDKLGVGLRAESEYGRGTRMTLLFPISVYIDREQED